MTEGNEVDKKDETKEDIDPDVEMRRILKQKD